MKTCLRKFFAPVISSVVAVLFFSSPGFSQTEITTDSADYQPGSTATITGTGFQPGESVRVQVVHWDYVPGDPITGADHEPWWVTADGTGEFVTTWHVCEDDCVGQLLIATADGEASGLNAVTLFTDAIKTWVGPNNGSWNTAANWSPAGVPAAGDDVVLPPSGITINVTASTTVNSIRFFVATGSSVTLNVNAGVILTVTNGINIDNDDNTGRTVALTGAGTITCASLTIGGTIVAPNLNGDATTTLTSSITNFTVSGNVTMNGVDDGNDDNNILFEIPSGTVAVGGTINTNEQNGSDVTLDLNPGGAETGTLILSGATPFNNINGTLTFDANGTAATVNYNRAGNQPIFSTTYRNLILSGSGSKTLANNITVNGGLTVTAGVVFAMGGNTVGNPTSVTLDAGAATGSSITGTGTLTLGGNVTVNDVAGAGTSGATIANPVSLGGASRTFTVADDGSTAADLTMNGAISGGGGGGALVKAGPGMLVFSDGTNSYTGTTTINSGELRLNPSADIAPNTQIVLNGGKLSTTEIGASRTITDASTLRLAASSTIDLGSNVHSLRFANSAGVAWTAATTLTIFGWQGTGGASGTAGKIFFDASSGALTAGQLAQISFDQHPGTPMLLSTGELVPPPTTPILAITGTTDNGTWCVGTAGTPVTYTITNTGTAASGVVVSSDDPQFVVSNLSSTNIAALGGTATFQITFTPNALGSRSGTITVTSTTAGSNSPTIGLTGTGTTPPVATFHYFNPQNGTNSWCQATASNPNPGSNAVFIPDGGGVQGTFTASSNDLKFVSTSTGEVNVATSLPGTYTVTNTVTANGCTNTATTTIVILALPNVEIHYSPNLFCNTDDASHNVTRTPTSGLVNFSYTPNGPGQHLEINEFTGAIVPSASDPGNYVVTMVFTGIACSNSDTAHVTISSIPVANFSYTGSPYCQTVTNPLPTFSGGGVAGTFSSTPGLVFVSTSTGEINLAASNPGTYTVTNTVNNGCPQVQFSSSVTITALPVAIFSYAGNPYCSNGTNPTPTFSSGGIAGAFTATPSGLAINGSTGEINLAASSAGTYTVTNTIAAGNGCNQVQATSTVTINTAPTVTQSTVSVCEGQSASLSSPYTCPGGGTFTSGPRNAGTGTSVNGPGTVPWANPQLITANDNNPATAALLSLINGNTTSDFLQGTNYGFNIPSNATIQGITVEISRHTNSIVLGASINDQDVRLLKANTLIGTNKALATDWPLAFTIQSYGGATDLWGTTWTPTEINATGFGASLSAFNQGILTDRTASVDFMRITVTYTLPNPTLAWYSVSSGGSPVATGSSFTPTNTLPGTYPYYVACSSVPDCRTQVNYIVKPSPTINSIDDVTYCNGEPVAGIDFGSGGGTATFHWTSTNDVGFGFSDDGNIGPFSAKNLGDAPVTSTVNVTATIDGCNAIPETFMVTVNPTPTVNDPTNQVVCNSGSTTTVAFTGNATSFSWTNDNTSIGLAASGNTNISSFTATNNSSSPEVATIVVTPHFTNAGKTCDGTAQTFTITVNPTPTVNDPTDQVVCNNTSTATVTFTGTGTSYSWTNDNISIGLGSSGNTNIAAFTATNTGTAPVAATITITPHYTNGGITCDGQSQSFTITVNPTPKLTSTLTPPTICTNTTFHYAPTSSTTGTTFNWTRAAVAGITNAAASGSGDPNETLVNTTAAAINVTYVYSLSANGCTNPYTYNVVVTVEAAPAISSNPSDQLKCLTESAMFTVTATGTGATYQWYKSGSATPLANISGKISGVTTQTLTISNIAVADAGDYYVVVTGTCSPAATSSSAHLMVKELKLSTNPATNPVTAQYSDPVKFTAKIYNGSSLLTANPTASVTFKVAAVNLDGGVNVALVHDGSTVDLIAEVTKPLIENPPSPSNGQMSPGAKTVTAYFNNISTPSSSCYPTASLTITKENAWITYTGDIIKATASATTTSVTLTLRANILDISVPQTPADPLQDAYPGDIRNARVTFVNRDASNAVIGTANLTPALVNSLDPKIGTASVPFTISGLSSSAPSQQIRIGIIVDNGYYVRNDPNDDIVVTGYIPVGDFITGGGYLIPTESVGSKASDDFRKNNFGFNVKFNKNGSNLQGNMNIIFRRTSSSDGLVHNYQIKTNSMQSLGVDASKPNRQTAEFVSKVTLKDLNNSTSTDPDLGGNKLLYVKLIDNGEPGVNDSISFVIVTGNDDPTILSKIIWSSNWVGNMTKQMNLTGGNLVVHSGFSVGTPATTNYVTRDAYTEPADQPFAVRAWPNPSERYFSLHVAGNLSDNVIIKVYDISGKQVFITSGAANHDYRFGDTFVAGVYIAEVQQGDKRSRIKLIKQ